MSNSYVLEYYPDLIKYNEDLTYATSQSKSQWEDEFIESLRNAVKQYGEKTLLSKRQFERLSAIVARND